MILTTLYEALTQRLKDQETGLVHIDLYHDQLEIERIEDIDFNLPAAFIDPQPIEWRSVGRHKMVGLLRFDVLVCFDNLVETDSNEHADDREYALQKFIVVDKITRALVGFNGEGFGSISRPGMVMEPNIMGLQVFSIPFQTLLTDRSAMREKEVRTAVPDVEAGFISPDNG